MLGRLAKWLRLSGFDTYYLRQGPFKPIAERTLVTRRSEKPHQPILKGWPAIIRLRENIPEKQLKEVFLAAGITRADIRPLTRCSVCNNNLENIPKQDIAGMVPDYVYETQTFFKICPGCARIYWPGTHQDRMNAVLERLF